MESSNINTALELIEKSLTPFKYHDEVVCNEKHFKMPDKNDVMYSYNTNFFNISDLHIVYVIARLHFSTMEVIVSTTKYLSKTKQLSGKVTVDADFIKSRIGTLIKSGLVKRYKFFPYKNKVVGNKGLSSYYLVTGHGYNFLKRILYYREPYDEYLAITPIEDVFKFLSANVVVAAAFNCIGFKGFYNNKRHFIKSTRDLLTTFSILDFEIEEEKYKLYVEPIKLSFNQQRISRENLKENIIMRLEFLKNIVMTGTNEKKYILFLAEDLEGLQYVSGFVKEYLFDYMEYIYLGTDASIYLNSFENSLIQLVLDDDKVRLTPVRPFFYNVKESVFS